MRQVLNYFLRLETSAGVLLGIASLLALFLANSPLAHYYRGLLDLSYTLGNLQISFLHFVNDGLMTIFFFLVSLEIKRELVQGELNRVDRALLPVFAAIGGMVVPALFYLLINHKCAACVPGWAIPMATDIAFSLAVLALLGTRVPRSLKVFLTALAIIDDLGSILVIAAFYTQKIVWFQLLLALICLLALFTLGRCKVGRFTPYALCAIPMWFFTLHSGIHATIAGVLFGLSIPLESPRSSRQALSDRLERGLNPWVAYSILPLFAFANTGLSLGHLHWRTLFHPLPLGIIVGLFLGKQCGIFVASWTMVRMKWAQLPPGVNWRQLYGCALIAGIGFTMSLFIANLAFSDEQSISFARLAILISSVLAGISGYGVLFWGGEGNRIKKRPNARAKMALDAGSST